MTLLYILLASSFAAELFRLVDWIERLAETGAAPLPSSQGLPPGA